MLLVIFLVYVKFSENVREYEKLPTEDDEDDNYNAVSCEDIDTELKVQKHFRNHSKRTTSGDTK